MNELLTLVTLGILVEAIVEVLKSVYQDGQLNKAVVLSLIIGIIIAFTMDIDVFELLGHDPQIKYVGIIATGTRSEAMTVYYQIVSATSEPAPK